VIDMMALDHPLSDKGIAQVLELKEKISLTGQSQQEMEVRSDLPKFFFRYTLKRDSEVPVSPNYFELFHPM